MSNRSEAAILYARVSTDGQEDGTSLETQLAACRAYAEQHGWTVWRQVEEVWSGADFHNRPLLLAARDDLAAGRAHHLIAYSQDRLSRGEPWYLSYLLEEATRDGWTLHSVSDPIDTSPVGQVVLFMQGWSAQQERLKILERTTRAKKAILHGGRLLDSRLYGYDFDKTTGRRTINPAEAATVHHIFSFIAAGGSIRALCSGLNQAGVAWPTGKRWGHGAIRRLVTEAAYAGRTFGWKYRRKPKRPGQKHASVELRPQNEWIELPLGTTPPIVDESVWAEANRQLADNQAQAAQTRNQNRPYLLRGRIRCGICGSSLAANPEHGKRTYRCTSRLKVQGACGAGRVPADVLERAIWAEIERRLDNPSLIADQLLAQRQHDGLVQRDQQVTDLRKQARTERHAVLDRLAEVEASVEAVRQAEFDILGVVEAVRRVRANLAALDFEGKRLALTALGARVVASGRQWRIEGSLLLGVPDATCWRPARRPRLRPRHDSAPPALRADRRPFPVPVRLHQLWRDRGSGRGGQHRRSGLGGSRDGAAVSATGDDQHQLTTCRLPGHGRPRRGARPGRWCLGAQRPARSRRTVTRRWRELLGARPGAMAAPAAERRPGRWSAGSRRRGARRDAPAADD
jgi:site-specific DNA recombinase